MRCCFFITIGFLLFYAIERAQDAGKGTRHVRTDCVPLIDNLFYKASRKGGKLRDGGAITAICL